MNMQQLNDVNAKVKQLNASGKVIVNCEKKSITALKGQLSCSLSGAIDFLKRFGMRLRLVEEL